ncbi:class I SAM-dependent DNA methyltransferase [Methylobacterium sp. D53M]
MACALGADGTRSFYETNAEAYAASTLLARMDNHHDSFLAVLPTDAAILDLGCGSGRDLLALAGAGLEPIGVDYSRPMASIARRTSGCPVLVADLRDLPFRTGAVDGIWAAASMLHLSGSDLHRALGECRRVLRCGGILYASVKAGAGSGPDRDGRFFAFHSRRGWRRSLAEVGFDPISVDLSHERRVIDGRHRAIRWLNSLSRAV